jgi:general stress protein YciG
MNSALKKRAKPVARAAKLVSQDRQHMADIGREGGQNSHGGGNQGGNQGGRQQQQERGGNNNRGGQQR